MQDWKKAFEEGLRTGAVASLTSTLALAVFGELEHRRPVAPTNATGHWLLGERAFEAEGPDAVHTAVGYVTHHGAAIFWSTFYEKWFGGRYRPPGRVLAEAGLMGLVGYVVDYGLMPNRLRPGWDRHLSRPALYATYAAFALGLALRDLLRSPPKRRPATRKKAVRRKPAQTAKAWEARVQRAKHKADERFLPKATTPKGAASEKRSG